ncbi:hypothetical protein ED733_003691 [Metarhizium rileyi]|uniref:F-box domain-containing protein n=1 Tax=Metarhizium rileyi (strain RCEF 4871) TaxID=1649241 RepID=A0A5C6G597_METRR|nr:hypothetical protein ED733_003691 [Metarhizium rileyi]
MATTTTTTGGEAAAAATCQASKTLITVLDLPAETQQNIVSHCSQGDLICLALVSRRFFELAAAQLYRNFHIIFPDEDDINFDSSIDGLAGGLDTFTTSEYNYAKHLKDFSMDTLSAGVKGEHSYQPYLYSASCGKFLNSLLYLTLKRAHTLESFRWNIRIELSRPVYAQLHRIRSLKRLHIRMQAGDSYYIPPPPLPVTTDNQSHLQPNSQWPTTNHSSLLFGSPPSTVLQPPGNSLPSPPPPLLPPSSRPRPKSKLARRGSDEKEPSTLSEFKSLKSLSVLDIDNLDIVSELRTCIKNCFSTIKELQLSLSDTLAQQARRPPVDSDADDSDIDDDFQVLPTSDNATSYDATGPAKLLRAQEEKKLQELILNKVFDIEKPQLTKKSLMHLGALLELQPKPETRTGDPKLPIGDPREEFISSIRTASTRLMAVMHGSRDFSISQQEALDIIEKAARKYVASDANVENPTDGVTGAKKGAEGSSSQVQECAIDVSQADGDNESKRNETPHCDEVVTSEEDLGQQKLATKTSREVAPGSRTGEDPSPDDIDIEHLETLDEDIDECDDQQLTDGSISGNSPPLRQGLSGLNGESSRNLGTLSNPTTLANQDDFSIDSRSGKADREAILEKLAQLHKLVSEVGQRVLDIRDEKANESTSVVANAVDSELALLNRSAIEVSNEIRILESEIEDLLDTPNGQKGKDVKQNMDTYARETRGLSIETLKISLIPVKASVLAQAVDVACIRELTLINVGNQAPIWSMLTKEQKIRPIALRSVFTDHVSASFLTCMSQLPQLDDLFMLERSTKYKPESFAPRTATSIDQIRRLVLKKHMPTLKRLMIKDESNGPNWDANEKTMILICTRGIKLEELALSLNIHAVHAFMQYSSGLTNLRAINILRFKNSDTCIWVMREILRFIVDNLSHHPELKLEWIAMEDDRVDRVVRPSDGSADPSCQIPLNRRKEKGKDKAHVSANGNSSQTYPVLSVDGLDSESENEEGDAVDSGSRLRFRTIGPLQFYDVRGVKIFEKEIRSGRL